MRKVTLISIFFLITAVVVSPAIAAEPTPAGCQPIYNGGTICSNSNILTVNKKVLNPTVRVTPGTTFKDSDFIENIGPNDPRYPSNALTAFRIYVTNTSRSTIKNISVKDIFPPRFVTFISGSGSYDTTSRTFTTTISELKAKDTKAITIQVMTARTEELPKDNSSLCTINLALASVNNKTSQDTSQICVGTEATPQTQTNSFAPVTKGGLSTTQPSPTTKGGIAVTPNKTTTKGGLPVTSPAAPQPGQNTPSTGPEALILAGLLPTGALGWLLRRKTS